MSKAYFCSICKKIFNQEKPCTCEGDNCVKEIKEGTPVNIVGTKLKGKVYRINEENMQVVITSTKERQIKTYQLDQVRKVL